MQLSKLPQHSAHIGRHGHNLSHDFSFTSGTGHLLTIFDAIMYPKDTISGKCEMFTRTQPLLNPANVEIDEYIDYFFVPLDMFYSGFGDYLYQVNEPYSSFIKDINNYVGSELPVLDFSGLITHLTLYNGQRLELYTDYYSKDWRFMSFYRNMFHNGINPNCFFNDYLEEWENGFNTMVHPVDIYQPDILPLTLLAYNCVYEHFYRLDDREEFSPYLYNIDSDLVNQNAIFYNCELQAVSLKYRPKNFDYFTSINPRPFFSGAGNIIDGSELKRINNYLDTVGIDFSKPDQSEASNIGNKDFSQLGIQSPVDFSYTSAGIRNMFAVEKLMQITSRAKKTYDAQVLAHLGVEVPHDVKHEIIHIGTQRSQIRVGEVVSTAGTSDTPLGDIAGKGYSSMDDNGIKFTAPVHGVFIGIYSAVPKFRYYAPLEKRNMITTRLDFFQPEYEKLGMQPVFGYEGMAEQGRANQILGWQMRFEQYKRRFNKVSPAFIDTILNIDAGLAPGDLQSFNEWHNWVLARRPLDLQRNNPLQELGLDFFLCGPDELNGLMAVDYWTTTDYQNWTDHPTNFFTLNPKAGYNPADPSTHDSFAFNMAQFFYRDPLLHFCKPNFKVVNQMQDNTLPDFID